MRVAVVQADAERGRIDRNLERVVRFVAEASRKGASLVVFPEMYLTGYQVWSDLPSLSLTPGSAALRRVASAALRHRIDILIGYPERRRDGIYNSVSLVSRDGTVSQSYRKIHLFGRERDYFRPGSRHRLVRLPGITVGLLVCYDLEFPEGARVLAASGADLIAVSTANMEPFRPAQEAYAPARALENQLFVALANRVGREGSIRFVGGSGIWGPSGAPLVKADNEEGVFVATIDRRLIYRARRAFNYLAERRPESYRRLVRPIPRLR